MHQSATAALRILLSEDNDVFVTPQNLIEFWNVCTRPLARNGLGLSISEVDAELIKLEVIFVLLPDVPEIYPEWRRLVLTHGVMGVNVHDTKLAAAMLVHSITHLLTFNTADFKRFPEIIAVHPSEITTAPLGR